MMARIRGLAREVERYGVTRFVFEVFLVIQLLHLGEHVVQMAQIHVLGWAPPAARGIVSTLDIETIHAAWNVGVLAALAWLLRRGVRSAWLLATFAWATLHTTEHGYLLTRALLSGREGAPGILGVGGALASLGWDMPGLTTWARATVHFAWNLVEVALLVVAYVAFRGVLPSRSARARVLGPRGAGVRTRDVATGRRLAAVGSFALLAIVLALGAIMPTRADHPITGLAPVETPLAHRELVGVVVAADGTVYASDADAGRVLKLAPSGQVTIAAGALHRPAGLALDPAGRLVIVESRADRVVRLEPNGSLTVLASGLRRPRWVAIAADGTLYVTAERLQGHHEGDHHDVIVRSHPSTGAASVVARGVHELEALALDGHVLYAAAKRVDGLAHVGGAIVRYPILTSGSLGAPSYLTAGGFEEAPIGLALDRLGALYVTSDEFRIAGRRHRNAIAKVHRDGHLTLFAEGLHEPHGLALAPDGSLYVADEDAGRLHRFRAPAAPALDGMGTFTNRSPLTVAGRTAASARVDVFVDDATTPTMVLANAAGAFTASVVLALGGQTTLDVFATTHGGDGLTSAPAEATITHDATAPTLAFQAPPAGTHVHHQVTVAARATDAVSGVASLNLTVDGHPLNASLSPSPPAAAVSATATWNTTTLVDGSHTLGATATDRASNLGTVTRVVIVDNAPPDTTITSGPTGETAQTSAAFSFTGIDNLTPTANLVFAWRLDGGPWSAFTSATTATLTNLGEAPHIFEVKARDLAGNEDATPAVRTFTVRLGPAITAMTPASAGIGAEVTITGVNFTPGPTLVAFNGTAAVVRSLTASTISTTVPPGARTGPVTITNARGVAARPFTVTSTQDFGLTVAPIEAVVLQGTSTTYTVALTNRASSYTGLASLSVTGLPLGVTASFGGPTLTGGQKTTLTLTAADTAALGRVTLTIQATATTDLGQLTRTVTAALRVERGGRTAGVGRFTFVDGVPIPGIVLTLAGRSTQTDAGGNFLLVDVPAGNFMLGVDANAAQAGLPIYAIDVTLVTGRATELGSFRITPPPPPERFVPIANATRDQVVTDPRFPGFSLTLPAGVTIRGWDGTLKNKIAIERLSPDAMPMPPPPFETRSSYQIFFGTPMGGVPSGKLPVTLPNDQDLTPGQKVEIWYYDAAPLPGVVAGWRLAGLGTVSDDGTRVVSDPGVGLERFCGVCGAVCINNTAGGQANATGDGGEDGDPVDLRTGLFILDTSDIRVPARIPAVVRRRFNPLDPYGRVAGFELFTGPGWALSIDVVLLEDGPAMRRLILPGNARYQFAAQSPTTYVSTHPRFLGAVLTADGAGGYTLRYKDGTTWRFAGGWIPRGRVRPIPGLSLLVEQGDRNGNALVVTRDTAGTPASVTAPGGRTLTFGLTFLDPTTPRLAEVRDTLGRVIRYEYQPTTGRLVAVTDPQGDTVRYTYDTAGRILTVTDARGNVALTNEYDAQGRVTRQTQADNGVWTYAYEGAPSAHTRVIVTDPLGRSVVHRIGATGFGSESADALGQPTQRRRNGFGQLTAIVDSQGRETRYDYDVRGNVTKVTDPVGHTRLYDYEPTFSRVTRITDELGRVTAFEYDATGNLTAAVNPAGERWTMTYDAVGQVTTITDPMSHTRRFTYDAQGNRMAVTDPLGNVTRREYDPSGRLVTRIDPRGFRATFAYDGRDRIVGIFDAAAGLSRFTHDQNGNLLTVVDAVGNTTTHAYDTMNRLVSRTDAAGRSESFTYDKRGNLVSRLDRRAQTSTYAYDSLNRVVRATYADGSSTRFAYDAAGRLVEAEDSTGGIVQRGYDALDRLLVESTSFGSMTYAYDAGGRRISLGIPGQPPVSYAYDPASRLTALTQGAQQVTLTYDPAGRRTRLVLPNLVATEYDYDAASRVTSLVYRNVSGVLGDLQYEYDAAGNRTGTTGSFARTVVPDVAPASRYGPANRQETLGDVSATYDANGNVTTMTDTTSTTAFTWDTRGRLVALERAGARTTFTYDAFGRRTARTGAGGTTQYVYDRLDVALETGAGGTTPYLRAPWMDEPFVRGGREFYVTASPGSVLAIADERGQIVTSYTYAPFGATTVDGLSSNPFQYAGHENEAGGLYLSRARYYSVTQQRFLSEDPIGFAGGDANLYAYVLNSPMIVRDPYGLARTIWTGGGRSFMDGPRNGNWGGANWSGGLRSDQHGPPAPPVDSGDECYMGHDLCWGDCAKCPSTKRACMKVCDTEIVGCLSGLPEDPLAWPRPPEPGTEADSAQFREWAIRYFGDAPPPRSDRTDAP